MDRAPPRLPDVPDADRTPEQRAVLAEATAGLRGRVPAPMRAWIASPELGRRAAALGEFLRYRTVLGPRLSELAILVTARVWSSRYEWHVHAIAARDAGLEDAIIEAIRTNRRPDFPDAPARVVHDAARAIHLDRGLTDAAYAEARDVLGDRGLAELVGLLGYYGLVSMTLNVFDIGVPEGAPDPFAEDDHA